MINKIDNTTKFRKKELSEGKIEVGENVCTEDLNIFSVDETSYIIPNQEKGIKCISGYNDYVTFIDTE